MKRDVLVGGMLVGVDFVHPEAQEDDPGAVWRDMRKPVICLGKGHLRRLTPLGLHPPYLHQAGADGIEPDILAVRRVLWSIV